MEALILSYALDTNGQNARYVQAAKKHGRDVIKALAIGKADPAGVVGRYVEASKKGGGLQIRSAHRASAYFEFPTDIVWDRRTEGEIRRLAERADVIHLNNSETSYRRLRLRKPALLHHHGSLFRSNPKRLLDIARQFRWQQAVSTIDLQKPAPELLPWLPTAYDVEALQAFGEAHRRAPDGRILIAHAPTNRGLKHTAVFLEAVKSLQNEGLPLDVDLIENVTWAECMERKARADIVFDQLMFGYGCNAVEAWALGLPVIAGAEDPWVLERMADLWGGLPFLLADAPQLKDAIRLLVERPLARAHHAANGLAHVRKYHDEKPALAILADLYRKAIERYQRVRIPGKAPNKVTFVQSKKMPIYDDDGQPIVFVDGRVETDDPYVIQRLRKVAQRRERFGIEEVVA